MAEVESKPYWKGSRRQMYARTKEEGRQNHTGILESCEFPIPANDYSQYKQRHVVGGKITWGYEKKYLIRICFK